MKEKLKQAFMQTAHIFAKLSYAKRLQVGCIIVKDNRIISIGYNGMPAGWDNTCEDEYLHEDGSITSITKQEVLHAESNAIAKLARSNESGEDAILFITHSPCIECAKLIYQAGIKEVIYDKVYRDDQGLNFLKDSQIKIVRIND